MVERVSIVVEGRIRRKQVLDALSILGYEVTRNEGLEAFGERIKNHWKIVAERTL